MSAERILLIRTGGLGDTLLMWPALSALRRRFPEGWIDFMGQRERCQLLAVPGGADRALDVEGSGLHHLFEISTPPPREVCARFGEYHAVVAFASPGDYALAENLSSCGVEEVHAFLPYPPSDEKLHAADHAKLCLVGVELALAGEDPPLPLTESERSAGKQRLEALGLLGEKLFLVAPGSGSSHKNWSAEGFAQVISAIAGRGLRPVLIQGPADREAVGAVVPELQPRPRVLEDDPPMVLKGILARASLYLGNDSGPTHLAALLGVPTVAIFGPSDPDRWGPRGQRVRVVGNRPPCAPCTREAMQDCPERLCLERVKMSDVLGACLELL